MTDKIFIQSLEVSCVIGTLPRERRKKQKLLIDLEFPAPVRAAAKNDDLRKALDYQKIAREATNYITGSQFFLLETLAERLAQTLLRKFGLKCITVCIKKPEAIRNAECAGVSITRRKN